MHGTPKRDEPTQSEGPRVNDAQMNSKGNDGERWGACSQAESGNENHRVHPGRPPEVAFGADMDCAASIASQSGDKSPHSMYLCGRNVGWARPLAVRRRGLRLALFLGACRSCPIR